jgi:hypothetical protein
MLSPNPPISNEKDQHRVDLLYIQYFKQVSMLPNIESFCGYVRQDGQRGIRETPFNPHQARVFGAVTPMATEERQNSFSKEAQCARLLIRR